MAFTAKRNPVRLSEVLPAGAFALRAMLSCHAAWFAVIFVTAGTGRHLLSLPEQTVNIPESDPVFLQGSHNSLKEPGAVFRSGCGFKLRNRLRQGCLFLLQGVVYRNVRRIQRQMAVKAAGIAQVAGGADGICRYQKTVGIAVGGNGLEIEVVPGFLSLGSETLLGTAPEGNPADFHGLFQCLTVHKALHQHQSGTVVLHDYRDHALTLFPVQGVNIKVQVVFIIVSHVRLLLHF